MQNNYCLSNDVFESSVASEISLDLYKQRHQERIANSIYGLVDSKYLNLEYDLRLNTYLLTCNLVIHDLDPKSF